MWRAEGELVKRVVRNKGFGFGEERKERFWGFGNRKD